jgi:hypothetical protein
MVDRVETVFVEAFANQQREEAGSAEEERKLGMAGLQARAASRLEAFENPDEAEADEEEQDEEGFEDEDAENAENAENDMEGEETIQEGFMNQYLTPTMIPSSKEPFVAEKAEAEFAPDYIMPMTIRNRKEDAPLYAIAEETEQNRIVDLEGIDESVKHAGTELHDAY